MKNVTVGGRTCPEYMRIHGIPTTAQKTLRNITVCGADPSYIYIYLYSLVVGPLLKLIQVK